MLGYEVMKDTALNRVSRENNTPKVKGFNDNPTVLHPCHYKHEIEPLIYFGGKIK